MAGQQDNSSREDKGVSGPPPTSNGAKADPTAVAQLVEQRIPNPQVAGSSPSRRDHHVIYKYGQGYWVRMMTAVFAGIMFLACSAWSWAELEKVRIPTPRWTLPLDTPTANGPLPTPGQTVNLLKTTADGQSISLASAVVESYQSESQGRRGVMTVGEVAPVLNGNPLDTNRVEVPGPTTGAPPLFAAHSQQVTGLALFPRVYLQAGVAALVMLLGCWLIYWYVGVKSKTVDFLIATDGEMKKVNWSTKKVIRDSTYVVIGATILIAGVIALADMVFFKFFQAIGVLGS
jgi:preprotein translocase SecE subunit